MKSCQRLPPTQEGLFSLRVKLVSHKARQKKHVTNITFVTLNGCQNFLIKSSWVCIVLETLRVYITLQ